MIGVRSAVFRLTRPGTALRFEIYPMAHIGEPAFYEAVADRLRHCDLIVAEGVGGVATPEGRRKSSRGGVTKAVVSALTLSYQLPAWFARTGLVEQNISYRSLGVPVRYPDMTDEQFMAGWRKVPMWQRALAVGMGPLIGLERLAFGSRRAIARDMALTDLDWQDELQDIDSLDELFGLLGEQRDRLLIKALDEIHRQRGHEQITVAVVYGAAHVAPTIHGMRALHGYGVRSAEWLTVFGF